MAEPDVILEAKGMSKRYGGTVALDGVDFCAYRNCVNVLIGENGAGKSTLMRILAGAETADEGELFLNRQPLSLLAPRDASKAGIAIVHQELSIFPNLDVTENVFAGNESCRGIFVAQAEREHLTKQSLLKLRKSFSVRTTTEALSLGDRQVVELARALTQNAKILILDEPTSALSAAETQSLFEIITDLKVNGVTIIYISHRLHELLYLGDYFTVLRSGRVVGTSDRGHVNRQWILDRMSNGTREPLQRNEAVESKKVALTVKDIRLHAKNVDGATAPISFTVAAGEIVALYGLLGSGRTELLETIAGCRRAAAGSVEISGQLQRRHSIQSSSDAGLAFVPEDRQRDGLLPEMSIRENVMLHSKRGVLLSKARETKRVRLFMDRLGISTRDLELPVTVLSGGNQQKTLLARALMRSPHVLVLDEPTRGVDASAKADIYRILRELADEGLCILFSSSEVEETLLLADRVLVMRQGSIAAELQESDRTEAALFNAASPIVQDKGKEMEGRRL